MTEPALLHYKDGSVGCWWAGEDPEYRRYHDREWGRPIEDERHLFELVSLEGFQSGLSWLTILRKRENFRRAFAQFEIEQVAAFGTDDVARLLGDAGIVRNRGKIEAVVKNARLALDLRETDGGLAAFVWHFAPRHGEGPASTGTTAESTAFSKALRQRGWSFVGPTTIYAFMQSAGLVNDHLEGCDVRAEVEAERQRFVRPGAAEFPQ